MEILFNDYSLDGQFSDEMAFFKNGLPSFLSVLKNIQDFGILLLSKSDTWERKVTPTKSLHSILIDNKLRVSDEIRRFKTILLRLTREPFWDSAPKWRNDFTYFLDGKIVNGSSLADACERDCVVASFLSSASSGNPIIIDRSGKFFSLLNLTLIHQFPDFLWENGLITFEEYLNGRFSSNKLNFSKFERKLGFSIDQSQVQNQLISTLKKFESMDWSQILVDNGLDFKEFHGLINEKYRGIKTFKFRASEKLRCHGFRDRDTFFVIAFETDHKRSDFG